MRVLGVGMLVVTLLAAGLAAFQDGQGLNPTSAPSPQLMQMGDGGSGMPPTPAP